jgi:hypothetical protein
VKKYLTTKDYKRYNTHRAGTILKRLISSKKRTKLRRKGFVKTHTTIRGFEQQTNRLGKKTNLRKQAVVAPSDLRLIHNTEETLKFFRDIRSEEYLSRRGNFRYVVMSLSQVTQIDYGTICVLTAINDEFHHKRIVLKTLLPTNEICRQFMNESGYLNNLFDETGKRFPKSAVSELIFFEKGCGILSESDNRKISQLIMNVVRHLTGVSTHFLPIKTVILEVCGNSIEWSGTESQQWLLGVKYEDNRVMFTVTDVGRGILDTLYRKFTKKYFHDMFKTSDEILRGAFDKKYGSTTQEANRNKGLPAVKANFEKGKMINLKVLTNNVILHFDSPALSTTLDKGSARFKGTFYQWEMSPDCLNKLID